MKKNEIQDERIITQRRKIQSDAYRILIYCLLASIIIQQFFLHAPFSQFAVEFFCFFGMGIYMTIRHLAAGIDIWSFPKQGSKKILISGLFSSIISVGLLMFLAGERRIWTLVVFFVILNICFFLMWTLINYLNNKKQKQIDKMINDEDE